MGKSCPMKGGANYHQGGYWMRGKGLFGGTGDNLIKVSVKRGILPIIYGLEVLCGEKGVKWGFAD